VLVERLVSEVRAAQQAVLLSSAMGGKAEVPSLDEHLGAFEAALEAEPARLDVADFELRRALGLRGFGG
jgi:hypothetical protein